MKYTKHFQDMLKESSINLAWVEQTLREPEKVANPADGTKHFFRRISEYSYRWLHVVVNVAVEPNKAITVFFDRRMKGK